MNEVDMRAVVFAAGSEAELLRALQNIPGYAFSKNAVPGQHPIQLTSVGGTKFFLRHRPGSDTATTSNILPQDHNSAPVALEDDEANMLSAAAAGIAGLEVRLVVSANDLARLKGEAAS